MPSPNRNNECNVNCQLVALFRLNLSAIFDLSCQMNQINISSPLQASSITITVTICSHYYDSVCCQVLTLPELRTNWGSCDLVTCLLSLASATVETIPPDMQVMADILKFTQCKILGKSAYYNKNFKVVSILLWRCFLYKEKYNVYDWDAAWGNFPCTRPHQTCHLWKLALGLCDVQLGWDFNT